MISRPLILLAMLLGAATLTAATAPARAGDIAPADAKLMDKFDQVFKDGDVEAAKKLIAAPNFRPTMRDADGDSLFERALGENRVGFARLMMASPGWKKAQWNARNRARALNLASYEPSLLPILQALARQPQFDLNAPGADSSPLAMAANSGNMVALKWLAKQPSVNINRRDENGYSAVFDAKLNAVEFLISLPKFDVNARTLRGQTALHYAVEMQQIAKVSALLQSPRINPNLRDRAARPRTPLDIALALRDSDIWEQRDAEGNNITTSGADLASVLLEDRRVRSTPAQRALFKRLKNSKPREPESESGSDPAADIYEYRSVMTDASSDVTPQTAEQLEWQGIIARNDVEATRAKTQQKGFDPAMQIDNAGQPGFEDHSIFRTALKDYTPAIAMLMMDAAPNDDYLAVPGLLDRVGVVENLPILKRILAKPNFDPNGDRNGGTPLYSAAKAGNIEALKILMADPRIDPKQFEDLLYSVVGSRSAAAAQFILADPRIDPMHALDGGSTALHLAVTIGDPEVAGALLADARVNINAADEDNVSPLQGVSSTSYFGGRGPDVALVLLRDPRIVVGTKEIEGLQKLIEREQDRRGNADKIAEIKRLMAMRAVKTQKSLAPPG